MVPSDSRLPFPVARPDRLHVAVAVLGLVATLPSEGTRLVLPAVEAMAEGGGRFHPDEDLVKQKSVALEAGGDDRLLDVRVPDVDGGVVRDLGQACGEDAIHEDA